MDRGNIPTCPMVGTRDLRVNGTLEQLNLWVRHPVRSVGREIRPPLVVIAGRFLPLLRDSGAVRIGY